MEEVAERPGAGNLDSDPPCTQEVVERGGESLK